MSILNSQSFVDDVVSAITSVTGPGPVELHTPSFGENESLYLKECIDTSYVSSIGPFVDRFEKELAEFTGANYAISTVNGTSALHLALVIAGILPGDEVLIPSFTFIATANAVSYCKATPHFVDISSSTLGIDIEKLRSYLKKETKFESGICINRKTGAPIRAIIPMHTFGHSLDMDSLMEVAQTFNLAVIEDAAESIGSYFKQTHTGTFGLMGILSFNGNKTITTGGGGAILTNDEETAKMAKHLSTTAKVAHQWNFIHDQVGYNYRMPNINAALGCAQLESLPSKLISKRQLFEKYTAAFEGLDGAYIFSEPENSKSNYWLQTLVLDDNHFGFQELILKATNQLGIKTRPAWELLTNLKPYEKSPRMSLEVSENLQKKIINLPSNPALGEKK